MITIWGRANSVNVQKVLWLCEEIALPYNRIDAGLQFGHNTEPAFLAMNPMGKVPTLVDGDFVLWESNSILRYLVMQYGGSTKLYPADAKARASIDRWLDWSLSSLQPAERPVFWGSVRTPEARRDLAKIAIDATKVAELWKVLDVRLQGCKFIEGDTFTIADIVLGAFAKRWFGMPGIERAPLPNLERWYGLLATRPGFVKYVDIELS
ncbi:glutathione S-transferase family protein [Burkholderia sp. Bp8991]|uniref:glutathione S-transferase family protein n=1 Tax=Burkholderia sp. Bp8991 TaxID=2184553 RepID=UPI000F5A8454|nr:glutathione S-transferase family protein [Burkholderia sp. Bp8991]RQS14416.1 glutathione S-transferase family protein [Burkholderia sp. Bp8991]